MIKHTEMCHTDRSVKQLQPMGRVVTKFNTTVIKSFIYLLIFISPGKSH